MHSAMAIQNLQAATPYQPLTNRNATAAATSSSSSGGSNPMDASDLGSTFLSLLSQELQNQDPTDPVDSTAMVGQMISLNQLDQLISINQSLSDALGGATTSAASGAMQSGSPHAQNSVAQSPGAASQSTQSPAASQSSPLPFDPNTMMPWGFGNPASSPTDIPASATGTVFTNNNLNLNSKGRN